MVDYIKIPHKITHRSFELIQEEINQIAPGYCFESSLQEEIIKRVIHTSADFDYLDHLKIRWEADLRIQGAIMAGGHIITDTQMALAGINKKILDEFGCQYHCFVSDPQVKDMAEKQGVTRSMAAIDWASRLSGPKVFVIGNAPTAIYRLMELVEEEKLELQAVVGIPVGFVGAAEAKEALHQSSIPSICGLGRKGGSNVAAAIINAIQYHIKGIRHQS